MNRLYHQSALCFVAYRNTQQLEIHIYFAVIMHIKNCVILPHLAYFTIAVSQTANYRPHSESRIQEFALGARKHGSSELFVH